MWKSKLAVLGALVCGLAAWQCAGAAPFSYVLGHPTRIENDLPGIVYFQIDVAAGVSGNCAAGNWLKYTPPATYSTTDQLDNVKGAYALLLAAVSSGARIAVYGDDSVSPCPITSVSVLAN